MCGTDVDLQDVKNRHAFSTKLFFFINFGEIELSSILKYVRSLNTTLHVAGCWSRLIFGGWSKFVS
jgi:hypothetical protein